MGKHENGFERVDRDLYPTPPWVIDALAEHVNLAGKIIWECACGTGMMAEALKANGVARVSVRTSLTTAIPGSTDCSISSPVSHQTIDGSTKSSRTRPTGCATSWRKSSSRVGPQRLPPGGFPCLLLPVDFDAAKSRRHLFGHSPQFVAKIILTRRIVWFERSDGTREAPKENHGWFLFQRPGLNGHAPAILRPGSPNPVIRYAPCGTRPDYDPRAIRNEPNQSIVVAASIGADR